MNQNFIKVQRPDGFQTKKGYYWAANPSRQHILDLEIERALKTMGRELVENIDIRPSMYWYNNNNNNKYNNNSIYIYAVFYLKGLRFVLYKSLMRKPSSRRR